MSYHDLYIMLGIGGAFVILGMLGFIWGKVEEGAWYGQFPAGSTSGNLLTDSRKTRTGCPENRRQNLHRSWNRATPDWLRLLSLGNAATQVTAGNPITCICTIEVFFPIPVCCDRRGLAQDCKDVFRS